MDNSNNNHDEIDLIQIAKTVWKSRMFIVYFSSLFFFTGIAIALLLPVVYTSSSTFILSNNNDEKSSIGGVASLVGINLGGITNENQIPPTMYPTVGESVEFKRLLLDEYIDENQNLKLKEFLIEYYDIDFETSVLNDDKLFVSEGEDNLFEILGENIISISVNERDGFVSISANMPTSEYAAKTCINARKILQTIIIDTKIKRAKEILNFNEEQLNLKKIEFDEIQDKIAYFEDSNLNIINSKYRNELNKLRAEFQIINSVYTELSKQLEQSKLQVNRDTPVFSIVKEASMPVKKSSPKRTLIVLVFGLLGFVISVFWVVSKDTIINVIKEVNS